MASELLLETRKNVLRKCFLVAPWLAESKYAAHICRNNRKYLLNDNNNTSVSELGSHMYTIGCIPNPLTLCHYY